MSPAARVLAKLVEAYQFAFSWRPSPCRYVPSCSNYALEALEVHGARRGAWLATRRVCRCHPWGPHGEDPVPRPDRAGADVTQTSAPQTMARRGTPDQPGCGGTAHRTTARERMAS